MAWLFLVLLCSCCQAAFGDALLVLHGARALTDAGAWRVGALVRYITCG